MISSMNKRKREEHCEHRRAEPPSKRARSAERNHFPDLSDELVVRTFTFLPIEVLVKVEQVCKRFQRLASDNEIWREKFYTRFVRPRAKRIPGLNAISKSERDNQALFYASKSAKWSEHNAPSKIQGDVDWKRKYKVKLNWAKGRCKAQEVTLDCPYKPRILVKISGGTIYTADEKKLRSYSQRTRPQILNSHYWTDTKRPTAMAVDIHEDMTSIIIGFSDGSLEVLDAEKDGSFTPVLHQKANSPTPVTSLASAWPYVLTMSEDHQMTLQAVRSDGDFIDRKRATTLASLRSDATLLPASLSIRKTSDALLASVAYSFSRLNAGWCLGLQEIRLGLGGGVLDSRVTSSVGTPMRDFPLRKATLSSRSTSTTPFALHPNLMNPPTSLSHSGCYILAGLPDNTLMVYTVTSTPDQLEISAGRRLFGHTSSVSGAEVSDRGKALSISANGNDIRVWELEDLLSSWSLRKSSIQLQPQYNADALNTAFLRRGTGLGLAVQELKDELAWNRHWVGFDDEQVIVLGEHQQRQVLSCFDFA